MPEATAQNGYPLDALRAVVLDQLAQLEREDNEAPASTLAARMGTTPRTLHRWLHDGRTYVPRAIADAALDGLGLQLRDVWPDEADALAALDIEAGRGFCVRCVEDVPRSPEGTCCWCEAPVARADVETVQRWAA